MQLDGFLTFLDSSVEVALTQLLAGFVANGIERNDFCKVVFVSVFLLHGAVDVGQCAVVVGVVACIEGVPETGLGRVFLRRASCCQHQQSRQ